MSGEATPIQMGGLLMALRVRGGRSMRSPARFRPCGPSMLTVKAPADAVDIVGTGGGGSEIGQCLHLCLVHSCRHRRPCRQARQSRLSSKSGAADVLMSLGVKVGHRPDDVARCISETGIGFMFAPTHHPAMKNVNPTRVELATRIIFNLLEAIVQSGRREAADGRCVLEALGAAVGASAEEPRRENSSGSSTAPTVSTRSPSPALHLSRR